MSLCVEKLQMVYQPFKINTHKAVELITKSGLAT